MADRLGASLFPAPGSQQRAATAGDKAGRNKVALRPGHSLMDWIRLTNSGKDLSGVGGMLVDVTPDELATHCHPHDAWIALKGKVYNVTAYMDFHPGGSEELMRGIGKEATSLFNEVHKWVNFESMLAKCLVGRLKIPSTFLLKGNNLATRLGQQQKGPDNLPNIVPTHDWVKPSLEKELQLKLIKPIRKTILKEVLGSNSTDENETKKNGPAVPKYDWYQTESAVSIVIYNKWNLIKTEHIVIDVVQRILRVLVNIQQHSYLLHLELGGEVEAVAKVKIGENTGNIEIILKKQSSSGAQWSRLGTPLDHHDTLVPSKDREVHYRSCSLRTKSVITHDTLLLSFSLPEGCHMMVPLGHHVHVKMTVENVEVSRSYTPVSLNMKEFPLSAESSSKIHLLIKVYDQGALTPHLQHLLLEDKLSISDPTGTFESTSLKKCQRLALVAAGTGFTPMVKLIAYCLSTGSIERQITLLFFNKTEKDIIWRDQLNSITTENDRFRVYYVLSEPSSSWSGHRGRLRRHLLETLLPPPPDPPSDTVSEDGPDLLVAICGPTPFTKSAIGYLEELGYSPNNVFAFLG